MEASLPAFAALNPTGWLIDPEQVRSSTLLLLTFVALGVLVGVLFWLGVIDLAVWLAGRVVRGGTRAGFRAWERSLSWASWPLFLGAQLALLGAGVAAVGFAPAVTVACALAPLLMGLAACLAYMFIDVERYEVARGYKALHNPLKGQRLAVELARHGHKVEAPLLASAAVGMIGGFALLNFGLFRLLGPAWYTPPAADSTYLDFVASALVHLLSVVDLLNLADTNRLAHVVVARPAAGPASALLAAFKSFFTLVLLQQIFASVRKGRLLSETVADFWSPHEPIHERARSALPQYGAVALAPLLLSLRTTETLTREQRDGLPQILAGIGPAAVPDLLAHLADPNEHVRAVVVATLARIDPPALLPHLGRLAADPSDLVRLSLAQGLGTGGGAAPPRSVRRRRAGRAWRLLGARREPAAPGGDLAGDAVPALRTLLSDATAIVRASAAAALGRLGAVAAGAVPDLVRLLADPDETVRAQAAETLGAVGRDDPATVPALSGQLADPSPAIRVAAARGLGSLRGAAASAAPELVPLLQDREEAVRTAAAEAVGRIGALTGAAADSLAEGLSSADNVVRAQTAEALGTVGAAAADVAPALAEAAADENDLVRAKAVEALGKMGEAAAGVAVPRLVRALRDPDNWVSALAAAALGEMGEAADGAVPALVRSLAHPNPQVRANAAESLGKLGAVAAASAPALVRAAADNDSEVRAAAVRALAAIGPPNEAAAAAVRGAPLSDADPRTRAAAAEAFGAWGHADEAARAGLLALLEDVNDDVKARAIRVLPRLVPGDPPVVESLSQRLADDSDLVRAEAARALGQFGAAAVAAGPALLRAAQTGEAGLREEAMRALAVAQPPEAAEAFTSGLHDPEPGVRVLASAGWRKAAAIPESAIPALVEALHDPEFQVRANAAYAVGRLDPVPAEAVPLLAECAASAHAGLRLNAALALEAAPGAAAADALHALLDDPNPRLRLIAARRALTDDASDPVAAAAVADALVATTPAVRESAEGLVEATPQAAPVILKVIRERATDAPDSESLRLLNEASARLEQKCNLHAPTPENTPQTLVT